MRAIDDALAYMPRFFRGFVSGLERVVAVGVKVNRFAGCVGIRAMQTHMTDVCISLGRLRRCMIGRGFALREHVDVEALVLELAIEKQSRRT